MEGAHGRKVADKTRRCVCTGHTRRQGSVKAFLLQLSGLSGFTELTGLWADYPTCLTASCSASVVRSGHCSGASRGCADGSLLWSFFPLDPVDLV
jgi:hypothetical protein